MAIRKYPEVELSRYKCLAWQNEIVIHCKSALFKNLSATVKQSDIAFNDNKYTRKYSCQSCYVTANDYNTINIVDNLALHSRYYNLCSCSQKLDLFCNNAILCQGD